MNSRHTSHSQMNFAVFDLETNGAAGSSAVSASSIIFDAEGAILDIFNRFYLPAERVNPYAEEVHGLTIGRLTALREHIHSKPYFADDWPELVDFWAKWNVGGVVVHNLSFDAAFLPETAQSSMLWWCSMKGLTAYCAIPKRTSHISNSFKWPRLEEATDIVCNSPSALSPSHATALIEEAVGEGSSHVSLFDCFELYRVVSRIFLHHKELMNFEPFVTAFRQSPTRLPQITAQKVSSEDQFVSDVLAYEHKVRSVISPNRAAAAARYSLGSTGSLSSASTPNTHSCTR